MKLKLSLTLLYFFSIFACFSQGFENMEWLNEPENWNLKNGRLTMQVPARTDFWRITHYGFTVDDGPFYYANRGGEFEVTVKITGDYKARFDQMGLMLRIDEKNWIKTGIEYVDSVYNFSTVITNTHSSWSVIRLKESPESLWIKAVRRIDAIEIFYSLNGKTFIMSNVVYLPEFKTVMVGVMAASPDGTGFKAIFEDFKIKHLPDERRQKWLEQNK
jgi:uncharacterized protein